MKSGAGLLERFHLCYQTGDFDFDLLVRLMYKESNPGWDENSPKTPFGNAFEDPVNHSRTDDHFIAQFLTEVKRSAPIRFSNMNSFYT